MVVKFVESDNEAYWIWLRDIAAPKADQKTMTVRIPRANRLSAIQWDQVEGHVHSVSDNKRAAGRAAQLRHNNR
jgi:hypothetical protein